MKWNFDNVVLVAVLSLACNSAFASKTIYSLQSAENYTSDSDSEIYIQAGSFVNKVWAVHLKQGLMAKTTYPVNINQRDNYSTVVIGPIKSAADTRKVAREILGDKSPQPKPPVPVVVASSKPIAIAKPVVKTPEVKAAKPKPHKHIIAKKHVTYHEATIHHVCAHMKPVFEMPGNFTRANWVITLGAGMQFPHFNSSMSVNNGSNFPPPANEDVYTTSTNHQPILEAEIGRRWERDSTWIPSYSLSLAYKYLLATNIGHTVKQYSSPAFTNYNYTWNFSANILLATAKINLVKYGCLSPYINGGIGWSYNRSSDYSEKAIAGVTPRTSPNYGSQTNTQFAYNVGAGIDVQLDKNLILFAGYEYLNLGNVSGSDGSGSWSGQSLSLGRYSTNLVMVGISYLFE